VRTIMRSIVATLAAFSVLSIAGMASAGGGFATTVTIKAEGTDLSGTVDSPRPLKCAKDRKIVVYKQKGREQRPSRDRKIGMDTASLNGDRYEWSTGNTGIDGKFYARAPKTSQCQADNSRTVRTN